MSGFGTPTREELIADLGRARTRITELNDIIIGDRPDLFHDSLIRGSRVSRMEDAIITLKEIIEMIDNPNDKHEQEVLMEIRDMAEKIIDVNPKFGLFTYESVNRE